MQKSLAVSILVHCSPSRCKGQYPPVRLKRKQHSIFGLISHDRVYLCTGALVVYMIMIGDVLVGTKASGYNGVLPTLVDDHSGEAWYLRRWFVVCLRSMLYLFAAILKWISSLTELVHLLQHRCSSLLPYSCSPSFCKRGCIILPAAVLWHYH